jgi:hypothetical protein
VANGKIRPFFWKPTDMMSVLLFISLFFVQVDLIPFRTNQQSFTFAGPENFSKSCYQFINSFVTNKTPHKNKTKSSGAIPTLILRPVFPH